MIGDPVLTVSALRAGYGGEDVIRDVDLQVRAGEVVALLGPNGAGKTTTLRAITGTVRRGGGTIVLNGTDVTSWAPRRIARCGVSHVIEGHGVFSSLTVAEHFRLRARGESVDREQAFEYFPALTPLAERRAGLLSGGEQQMLALARALARRPKLLLVDELSLGLAPIIVQRLLPAVRRYADEVGAGVLLVEQHVHLALQLADRGYVLAHGRIVLQREAQALRDDPASIVASYLGGTPPVRPSEPVRSDA